MRYPTLSISQVEKAIGIPAKDWEGNCYGVACLILKHKLVQGSPVYGLYLGEINPDGYWESRSGSPAVHHGWIDLKDGGILDPTRWSFEAVNPYLFYSRDASLEEYDAWGMKTRQYNRRPPPAIQPGEKMVSLKLSKPDSALVLSLFGERKTPAKIALSISQLFWLANLSPLDLGSSAERIFDAIEKVGHKSFIPIDSRAYVYKTPH